MLDRQIAIKEIVRTGVRISSRWVNSSRYPDIHKKSLKLTLQGWPEHFWSKATQTLQKTHTSTINDNEK